MADKDEKFGWTMSREVYPLHLGESQLLNRGSSWTAVSLSNVVEFAKIQNASLPDWVLNWRDYSYEKQVEVYSKEVCHEFNFFLKRNDPKFFESVVQPFLKSKIIKTFIDHYLLEEP